MGMSDIVIQVGGDRPRAVFDPNGPGGEPIETPTDHRLLWWLRHELLGAPDYMRGAFDVLNEYLKNNCQHHWREYPECCTPPIDDCYPPHRQCLWCNDVEPLATAASDPA